ncbi:MAG: HEPN domain-containing protein [Desulfurococcaceae archaeon]|nr:HEPN domain-containing protein [Desulfurococcaceae archaeon]
MSTRLYEELVKRAVHFYKVSDFDASSGRYDIALFHLEQAVQLALKAHLLKTLGDYPRIHSIKDLVELCENECLRRLVDEYWYVIDILEDAYIGGRYLIRRYSIREFNAARKFVEEVFKCTGITST